MLATEAAERRAADISAFAEAAKAEKAVEAAHTKLKAAHRKAAVAGAAVFVEYAHVRTTEARATDSRAKARAAADAADIAHWAVWPQNGTEISNIGYNFTLTTFFCPGFFLTPFIHSIPYHRDAKTLNGTLMLLKLI